MQQTLERLRDFGGLSPKRIGFIEERKLQNRIIEAIKTEWVEACIKSRDRKTMSSTRSVVVKRCTVPLVLYQGLRRYGTMVQCIL